jgi:RHH-type proline utilization regulon transcriptional repressor/proline dehydrogenase/delta 1-pyrroline-5-carboxylate dehydrogenase
VHTRIDETIAQVVAHAKAGNVYVNRNIVGAVVGVQPFGGEGLSGTGPKAGGPLYMLRMLSKRPDDAMARAVANGGERRAAPCRRCRAGQRQRPRALAAQCDALRRAVARGQFAHAGRPDRRAQRLHAGAARSGAVPGRRRGGSPHAAGRAVLSVGSTAIWPADAAAQALRASLPAEVQPCVAIANDWTSDTVVFDAALHHGDAQRACGRDATPGGAAGADRRRARLRTGRCRHSARKPGGGTRAERQHGGGRRQCEPDDDRLSAAPIGYLSNAGSIGTR